MDRPLYGTRPNPADIWRELDRMLATSKSQTVTITDRVYSIIRSDAEGDIASHEYKDGVIRSKTKQVDRYYKLLGSGHYASRKLYQKKEFEFNYSANKRERAKLVGVLRETSTRRDLSKDDFVEIGAIVSAILYEEYGVNLNEEILKMVGEEV